MYKRQAWFSSNFLKGAPELDKNIVRPYIKMLLPLLNNSLNSDIIEELIWMFNYYLDVPEPDYIFINNLGIYKFFKKVFESNQMKTVHPILRIFGKLSLGNSQIIQGFLDEKFKNALIIKINSIHSGIQEDALWTLSNIILTGTNECTFMSDPRTINLIRDIALNNQKSFQVRNNALLVFKSYFFQFGISQREELVFEYGYIDCIFMAFNSFNQELVDTGLTCIEEILIHAFKVHNNK